MSFLTNSVERLAELTTLNIKEIDRPVLTYDSYKKQIVYTFVGRTIENKEYIIELRISVTDLYRLERVIVYTPQDVQEIPIIVGPIMLDAYAGEEFSIPIIANTTNNKQNIENQQTPFCNSVEYVEMLNKLKAAENKGCV